MDQNLGWVFISALLVNNFTLTLFLGLCPFFGVSSKLETGVRLGAATIFVMVLTILCTWTLDTFVLPHAPYLQLITYIVVIASVVQFVEMTIKKLSPALFRALGIYLPLITTNCAILAIALFAASKGYGLLTGIVYALGAGGGLTLALVLMAGIREALGLSRIPNVVKGTALSLFIAGLLSLGFMGFAGLFSGS